MSNFTPELSQALEQALVIAESARPLFEVHSNRWVFSFETRPHLHVVAPIETKTLGLALLLIEQLAITQAQQASMQAIASIQRLQDLPPATEQLQ